ncbi:MAG: formylglycine-generating enzyme family protein [Chryseosolibacter sp.]
MLKNSFIYSVVLLLLVSSECLRAQDTFVNTIGMEFVRIRPGSMLVGKFQPPYPVAEDTVKGAKRPLVMWMGDGRSYNEEEFRLAREFAARDARSGFRVRIERAYYIGKFEVMQGEWKKVMGSNPSVFRGGQADEGERRPVENVTWDDVQEFLGKLNTMEHGKKYRLPTEFEWEYAARAGAEEDISWSETQLVAQLGGVTTQLAGQKKPNAWGLYDMLGNVWEWVEDYYNEKIFADPQPPGSGSAHVLKGASFTGDVKNATWLTHAGGPGNGWDVGFRVVLEVTEE